MRQCVRQRLCPAATGRGLIEYRIRSADLNRHHFEVVCRIDDANEVERVKFPSWIPGSYLLREFARNVIVARASCGDRPIEIEKTDNSTWECRSATGLLEVTLTVYALDESVRGAYVDARRAYFNGPCVFPCVEGKRGEPARVLIEPGEAPDTWRVATAMRAASIDERGFGTYVAEDYDELIDHPVEISDFESVEFIAGGVPHVFALAGRFDADLDRVAADLQQLCASQIDFFGGQAPFDHYCFLGLVVGNGYGGLEHRASSSLIVSRDSLPKFGETGVPTEYQRFLGLCSHEYFHAWHIKRTKPSAFIPYRLNERNYTRLLWAFEGVTSYYQELFLLRSGLIGAASFLRRIAELLTRVYRAPGRHSQSVAEASFDAWDGLYKPGPNSPNASVNYYSKGGVVALALDLTMRRKRASAVSLDDVVKALWHRFGSAGEGLPENGFEELSCELGGGELHEFFDLAVRGTEDLPIGRLLDDFGVTLEFRPAAGPNDKGGMPRDDVATEVWLGAVWRPVPLGLELSTVLAGGPAEAAGANHGDILIALDGLKVDVANLAGRLARLEVGEAVVASIFRGDELLELELALTAAPNDTCVLRMTEAPPKETLERRRAWLGE
jgi:predicted metalloprotease with PDZ domain